MSVGALIAPSKPDTSTVERASSSRAAISPVLVRRQSSLNQPTCAPLAPGMNRDVKTWRNTGFSLPQPILISSSIARYSRSRSEWARRAQPRA